MSGLVGWRTLDFDGYIGFGHAAFRPDPVLGATYRSYEAFATENSMRLRQQGPPRHRPYRFIPIWYVECGRCLNSEGADLPTRTGTQLRGGVPFFSREMT
jgi:hypothetical protein